MATCIIKRCKMRCVMLGHSVSISGIDGVYNERCVLVNGTGEADLAASSLQNDQKPAGMTLGEEIIHSINVFEAGCKSDI